MAASLSCFRGMLDADDGRQKARRKIDRTMIGEPMNFRHTGHIGTGDMMGQSDQLHVVQKQMQSKGGYDGTAMSSTTVAINLRPVAVETKVAVVAQS